MWFLMTAVLLGIACIGCAAGPNTEQTGKNRKETPAKQRHSQSIFYAGSERRRAEKGLSADQSGYQGQSCD